MLFVYLPYRIQIKFYLILSYGGQSSGCKFQSSHFDEGYTQQDIPSTTQRYILRSSINNSMI